MRFLVVPLLVALAVSVRAEDGSASNFNEMDASFSDARGKREIEAAMFTAVAPQEPSAMSPWDQGPFMGPPSFRPTREAIQPPTGAKARAARSHGHGHRHHQRAAKGRKKGHHQRATKGRRKGHHQRAAKGRKKGHHQRAAKGRKKGHHQRAAKGHGRKKGHHQRAAKGRKRYHGYYAAGR